MRAGLRWEQSCFTPASKTCTPSCICTFELRGHCDPWTPWKSPHVGWDLWIRKILGRHIVVEFLKCLFFSLLWAHQVKFHSFILCMLQIQYNAVSAQINHLRMWFVSLESKWLIITITSFSLFTFKFSKYINEAWSRESIREIKGFNLRCRTSVLTQTLLTCLWGQRLWQTSSCCSLVPILKPTPLLYGCSSLLPWQTNLWSLPTPV